MDEIRIDKVKELKRAIERGGYITPGKLDYSIRRALEDDVCRDTRSIRFRAPDRRGDDEGSVCNA